MSARGAIVTVLATELSNAVRADEAGGGHDIGAGLFGDAVSTWIRKTADAFMAFNGLDAGKWTIDEYGSWILTKDDARVFIQQRPPYCDRGHWIANVDGIPWIDGADAFPRYFMDLNRAKIEMKEWLDWRLRSDRKTVGDAHG